MSGGGRERCDRCGLPKPVRHDNPIDPGICWAEYDLRAKIACRDRVIARLKSELEGMRWRIRELRIGIDVMATSSNMQSVMRAARSTIDTDDALSHPAKARETTK